jgi:hypothetical protein
MMELELVNVAVRIENGMVQRYAFDASLEGGIELE